MAPITTRALCSIVIVVVSSVFSIVCRTCGDRLVHAKLITGAVIGEPWNPSFDPPNLITARKSRLSGDARSVELSSRSTFQLHASPVRLGWIGHRLKPASQPKQKGVELFKAAPVFQQPDLGTSSEINSGG
jgi:hypothetical protein